MANQDTIGLTIPHLAYIDNVTSNPAKSVGERMLDYMHSKLPNAADDEEECKQFLLDMGILGHKEDATVEALIDVGGPWTGGMHKSGSSEDSAAPSSDRAITEELADSEESLTVRLLQHERSTSAYADDEYMHGRYLLQDSVALRKSIDRTILATSTNVRSAKRQREPLLQVSAHDARRVVLRKFHSLHTRRGMLSIRKYNE